MTVVSSQVGFINIPRSRHVAVAVQYDKNDSGEAEPGEFTQGEQVPTFNLSKKIRIPALDLMPESYAPGFVPLKSAQQNSRPTGAAQFDAPFETDIQELPPKKMKRNMALEIAMEQYGSSVKLAPKYPYNEGITARSIPMKMDEVDLPSALLFRS